MRIVVCRAHEARHGTIATRKPLRTVGILIGLKFRASPFHRLAGTRGNVGIIVEMLDLLWERWLIGEHIDIVIVDVHAVLGAFDDDAAGVVGDDPMQCGHREPVIDGLADDRHVLQSLLYIVHTGEVEGDPQGELVCGHVRGEVDRLGGVLAVLGEVETRHGEAGIVHAVEIQRRIFHDDADADHRVVLVFGIECRRVMVIMRGEYDFLPVILAPIEIAAEVHIVLSIVKTNGCAHCSSFRYARR